MANNGLLIKLEENKVKNYNNIEDEDILLTSKYVIPFFWLAIFDKDCIKEENFEEGEEKYIYPVLISSKEEALLRFNKNKEKINSNMPNKIKKYYNEFKLFLENLDSKYLQVDFLELFVMGNDEMKEELLYYFKYFEESSIEVLDKILKQCGFKKSKWFNKIKYEKNNFKYYLRGEKHNLNLNLEN